MRAHRRRALRTVGIDFSAPEADMRNWLNDSEFTPYSALASTLLKLLEGKRLRQPVQLDVIRGYYEEVLGASVATQRLRRRFSLCLEKR